MRTVRFCDLHGETPDAARAAVDQNCLARLKFRHIDYRLPRRQRSHWNGGGLYKVERPGFRSDFPFFYRHVIRPAAAESWITVNRVAYFEFRDVCPRLLHNASDVVARNQRQMRSEFLGVFPAQR